MMYQWIANLFQKHHNSAKPARPAGRCHSAIEGLEDRRVLASTMTHGLDITSLSSKNYSATLNMLRATNTHTVRMWATVSSYGQRGVDGTFKYIRKLHSAGIDITLSVVPHMGITGSQQQIKNYFNWLYGQLGGSVSRWEIGNEPDITYRGGVKAYVPQLLKPASQALHSHGAKVISGGVSWNPADIKTMVDEGMLNYVDYVGYHPYRFRVSDLQTCISQVKSYVQGKPIIATEWNIRGKTSTAGWVQGIKEFWPVIRDNFAAAYYYAAIKAPTQAGPAGVLANNSGAHNGSYYEAYKSFGSGLFSSTKIGSTSTPTPTSSGTSSTESIPPTKTVTKPAVKAVVSAFRILDGRTGKVLKGFEHITASETIKASALPTRYIQIEAITSKTGSVRFTFSGKANRTENNAPFTLFVNRKGAASSWFAAKGSYTLSATAYTGRYLGGTKGNKLGIVLTFR